MRVQNEVGEHNITFQRVCDEGMESSEVTHTNVPQCKERE